MCEVLAPAGDEAAFYAALHSGADAIYLGLKDFSARRAAANFDLENLPNYTAAAHVCGAKVYVALNTLVKDAELDAFFSCALSAWNAGADALIIQDLFLGRILKETYPEMQLHLSTQAGVCNIYGARLAKRFGFSRVILARETPLADIAEIASEIETEVFVQGALCTCFSGQCYLSSLAGGNSGNRGLCKQPCRKKYSIDRKGFEKLSYKISLSDLCVGEEALRLAKAGVSSFKIEGRMRSAAYVGAAVRYYKDIFAGASEQELRGDLSDLKRTFNRGNYTRGLAFGQDKSFLSSDIQGHIGESVGVLCGCKKGAGYVFVRSSFLPRDGDGFKVIRGGKEEAGGGVWRSFYPTKPGGFYLPMSAKYRDGDEVFVTSDTALAERIARRKARIPVTIKGEFCAGKEPKITVRGTFGERTYTAEFVAEEAKSRAFSREEFENCFAKTDEYPFAVSFEGFSAGKDCFIVRSALNAFRRNVYARLYNELSAPRLSLCPRKIQTEKIFEKEDADGQCVVIDRGFSQKIYGGKHIDIAVFEPHDYKDETEIAAFLRDAQKCAHKKYLYLPAFCTGEDLASIKKHLSQFDGVYAEGAFALEFCREQGVPLFAGTGFNLFNRMSAFAALNEGADRVALSKELSASEITAIGLRGAFVVVGGRVQAMELGYCPFSRDCAHCDKRAEYVLTDESGRKFPLLRYENSQCRFQLFNYAPMISERKGNVLFDFRALDAEEKRAYLSGEAKKMLKTFTGGALKNGTI